MAVVLYVTQPGAFVHITSRRLRVMQGKTLLEEVRMEEIERVVFTSGSAGLSTQAATSLMEAGIETAFLSSGGVFRGWLSPARGTGILLRVAQWETFADAERRLAIARTIVAQKIRNSDALLARFARNHSDFNAVAERARLTRALVASRQAANIASLLGHEGDAAAAYFGALGRMVRHGFAFTTRSRRPPRDPANAILSFGYTLLASEATSAIAGAGLDPALGMLHTPEDGRPSLGLDLTEEFRHAVGDRLLLHLANNRILTANSDFEMGLDDRGCRLRVEARRKLLLAYEGRMTEPFHHSPRGSPTCLRECLRQQAHRLALTFRDGGVYHPFVLR